MSATSASSHIKAIEVVVAYTIIQKIEGHTLVLFVMTHTVDLNPLTLSMAVLLGAELFGVAGGGVSLCRLRQSSRSWWCE